MIDVFTTAVKINNLKVPSEYILDKLSNPEVLILDCEYDLPVEEQGFVLKWFFNDLLIYQWISLAPPRFFFHNTIRNHVDMNYTASDHVQHKHRALAITKPDHNMTGTYTCSVGTFQSEDKKSQYMQIIQPEKNFQLKVEEVKDESGDIDFECYAQNVYPEPKLIISIGDTNQTSSGFISQTKLGNDGLWDITTYGRIKQSETVIDPSDVHCLLFIPNTSYSKQKQASQFTNQSSNLSAPTAITLTTITLMLSSMLLNNV
ncbi:hypothetical protein Bhyg_03607 [Pseudolycoriella hygida]|uniref:Ig-like domain-containing protein n=1 Tax=Pseudolycoriella hygida TaxID=35572 RepID=A0A9Q0NF90_9DIPT|nr:hypothetical protein Bhyg_03607 [Pseudolycoriella hygida]